MWWRTVEGTLASDASVSEKKLSDIKKTRRVWVKEKDDNGETIRIYGMEEGGL